MTRHPPIQLKLRKNINQSILAGHPWVYDHAIQLEKRPKSDQRIAEIYSTQNEFLAKGIFDSQSPLRVRIFTNDSSIHIDEYLLHHRLQQSMMARLPLLQVTNAFRLCHGEADFLPGIVIDVYDQYAVIQFDSLAIREHFLPLIPNILISLLQQHGIRCQGILEKSRFAPAGILHGNVPHHNMTIEEHQALFEVNLWQGQKTGFFLDQRKNRLEVKKISHGKKIWNGFCYTGGFSVQAAQGGALEVTSVDSAMHAIKTAKKNFVINQIQCNSHFVTQDAFATLKNHILKKELFDLVIVDPPSFAHSQKTLSKAKRVYQELFSLALQITQYQGIVALSSCSSHLTFQDFREVFAKSCTDSHKEVQLFYQNSNDIDHPVLPSFPEGNYLKFMMGYVRSH